MRSGGRSKKRLMNEINVVPYIDVMLVLLVIFMVTAPLMNPGQVDLPQVGKSLAPPVAPLEVIIKRQHAGLARCQGRQGAVSRDELVAIFVPGRVRKRSRRL